MKAEDKSLIEVKQNIFVRIINRIRNKFFKIKNKKAEDNLNLDNSRIEKIIPKTQLEEKYERYKKEYDELIKMKNDKIIELKEITTRELKTALKIYKIEEEYLQSIKDKKIEELKQLEQL